MERHRMAEHTRYERLYGLFLAYAALLALFGLIMDTPVNILRGLSTIILTEDALITDYVLIAGPGAALVNSALVTAISTLILRRSGEPFNGFSPVVVGLMSGFSLFGKNFVNIWPILLGTFLYAKSRREPVGKYAPVGLLATALAPVVSYIALDNGWGTPLAGGLVGILIGFIMPPLSAYTYKIQNGMNLYNVGFACGLVAFILDSMVGVIFVKILNIFTPKNKINPMVGAAGISAFPMSSRVIEKMGQEADSQNHLLMHAVAANVSGQIASVVAGGVVLQYFANMG